MRRLLLLLGLLLATPAVAQPRHPFDGTWDVTVTCPSTPSGTLGYTLRFPARVEAGMLLGEHRGDRDGSQVRLEGPIRPDGSAALRAEGLTGDPAFAAGGPGRQTPYRYTVEARFAGDSGSGRRIETRRCDLAFRRR